MHRKPFQCKPTEINCSNCGKQVKCSSDCIARLTLSLCRMRNDPTYTPPMGGYDEDVELIADCVKNSTKQTIRHYDRNVILLVKKQ